MLKIFVLLCSVLITNVYGHGMMLEPVGRQSRWRYDSTAVPNYTDNELFCGGAFVKKILFLHKNTENIIFGVMLGSLANIWWKMRTLWR